MTVAWDCVALRGDRPCRHRRACEGCPDHRPAVGDVLLVQLGALGDVVRTTALLPAIRRAFPDHRLAWLTAPAAAPLLDGLDIDRVLTAEPGIDVVVRRWGFSVALGADRDPRAAAWTAEAGAADTRGFVLGAGGIVRPADARADPLFRLGIDDDARRARGPGSEPQLRAAALGLSWSADCRPRIALRPDERAAVPRGTRPRIGWNTGASYAYKHWTFEDHLRTLRSVCQALPAAEIALLGGAADVGTHTALLEAAPELPLRRTPTGDLRLGAAAVASCDVVVTGDTLALHLADALGVPVLAWFGPTPEADVDLRGRGVALPSSVSCRPCWQQRCDREPKCFRTLDWAAIPGLVRALLDRAGEDAAIVD